MFKPSFITFGSKHILLSLIKKNKKKVPFKTSFIAFNNNYELMYFGSKNNLEAMFVVWSNWNLKTSRWSNWGSHRNTEWQAKSNFGLVHLKQNAELSDFSSDRPNKHLYYENGCFNKLSKFWEPKTVQLHQSRLLNFWLCWICVMSWVKNP